jgi:hypothetical protein
VRAVDAFVDGLDLDGLGAYNMERVVAIVGVGALLEASSASSVRR